MLIDGKSEDFIGIASFELNKVIKRFKMNESDMKNWITTDFTHTWDPEYILVHKE